MTPKPKKAERSREHPRQLPSPGDSSDTTLDVLLEGTPLEDSAFADLDLSNRRIPSLAGSNLIFERVSFAHCEIGSLRLFDVRLVDCDLSNTMLRAFEATRVEFIDCKLVGMNALGCQWQDVLLDHCDARFAQLSEARIRRCEIRSTQLREAALSRIDLEATQLIDVVLRKAELGETRLAGVDLTSCDIEEIALRVEDLRGAIVSAPQAMELARFLEVIIK
ncbi:pentapeptide repeat-containing protein [Granulicella sp. dw_53]|uniref:pentapeptide repeat-containing protein n=1 Tax=Granulicella sp. dw_53 TaxID=2719792 RepID=UPI001BD4E1A3|nr:pentapeptide repeat-containing protein [Granulicella sp. dw_53]